MIPKKFRKAIVNGIPLNRNEIILKTLYDNSNQK